jgi:pheromone shutdown protein TraB
MVESLKQKDLLSSLMSVLKSELPLVYQALIGERDIFMANSILMIEGKRTVGVVGK